MASAAMSTGVLADAPAESAYSDILNNTDGDGSSSNPHVVTKVDELQAINSSLSAHYVLGNDINASETETWKDRKSTRLNSSHTATSRMPSSA